MLSDFRVQNERRQAANAALEAAALDIEKLRARDPWISGEVLALDNAIATCAARVRAMKR